MLISCNKLKSHIKDSEKIDWLKVWDKFTIRTAEVEGVTEVGNQFTNVVVAQIKECKDHPDSDHLHILKVDIGEKDLIQVVCGAPNVKEGLKTAYIKVGGTIDGYKITSRPLRGVESNGMCCSGKELGISDNHEGIIEFPSDAPLGEDIKKYLPIEDIIVEIDNKSLTNRPDLWGHYGIAREIAAITETELLPLDIEDIPNDKTDLSIKILDEDKCYRYCGLKIDNIKNNITPLDMQIFLYYTGMRSISLLVDLTNYLMLELGQPMHAFDSKVVKEIEVGLASDGDKYTTLDGVERNLSKDTLMIKNNNKYFAIAGIMGGLDSEILDDTESVFLESATFDAASIRKSAVALGLRTESSARYEKSLDPNLADVAIKRLVYLLKLTNPNLKIVSNLTDVYPKKLEPTVINLRKELLNKYMGKEIDNKEIISILESLEFKVKENSDSYEITVPTFRHSKDINIEQDLIEEIARMYGLENFEPTPLKLEVSSKELESIFNQEYEVKNLLATKFDLHEVNSYLWYDTNMLKELNIQKEGVKLLGKTENNILRDDLSLSLMNIVNLNFKNYNNFKIFEIGTIIKNNTNKRVLSVILASEEKNISNTYNEAKIIVKYLFDILKNKSIDFKENLTEKEYFEKELSKNILLDNEIIGSINVLKKSLTNKLSKKKCVVCIDIDFDKWVSLSKHELKAETISKYPTVELDYTIELKDKYAVLENILSTFKSNIIIKYYLHSIYNDKYTIRFIVGSKTKTLEQNDLQKFKERFIDHLNNNNLKLAD